MKRTAAARAAAPTGVPLPPFRAVVMDMDGLAIDTEATYCAAWRGAAAALGFPLTAAFCRGLFGRHADDVRTALVEACGAALDLQRFFVLAEDIWYEHLRVEGVAKMPALDRLLGTLKANGLPYALATNSDGPYAREVLQRAEASALFPIMVTRDEVPQGKPAPDLFLEAARRLGVPPADCLGLEDSSVGLEACRRAGLIPVLIPSPAVAAALAPRDGVWVMQSLAELADHIETGGRSWRTTGALQGWESTASPIETVLDLKVR